MSYVHKFTQKDWARDWCLHSMLALLAATQAVDNPDGKDFFVYVTCFCLNYNGFPSSKALCRVLKLDQINPRQATCIELYEET